MFLHLTMHLTILGHEYPQYGFRYECSMCEIFLFDWTSSLCHFHERHKSTQEKHASNTPTIVNLCFMNDLSCVNFDKAHIEVVVSNKSFTPLNINYHILTSHAFHKSSSKLLVLKSPCYVLFWWSTKPYVMWASFGISKAFSLTRSYH